MRFLIGIITGSVLTLLIATILDAPTRPTLDLATNQLDSAWDQLIDTTSEQLFGRHSAPDPESVPAGLPADATEVPPEAALPGVAEVPPGTAEVPVKATDIQLEVTRVPPEAAGVPHPVASARLEAEASPEADVPSADASAMAPLPLSMPESLLPTAPGFDADAGSSESLTSPGSADPAPQAQSDTAAVWVPFHSQRSAEGFAARLSRELDHPFSVERRRAGTYQVVFSAPTADEQDAVLARIAELTGS